VRASLLAAIVAPTLIACATNQSTSTDVQAIQRTIDSMDVKVQDWFNHDVTDSIVAKYYASDAVVIFPNSPALKGSDAIRTGLTDMMKTMAIRLHFQRGTLIAADSLASDQGTYTIEMRARPDTTKVLMSDHGNYVTTFVKRNGEWRAVFDIASSEVPMPAPAPAPGAKKSPPKK